MDLIAHALAPWSPLFLPVIFPAFGYVVAYILRQAPWPLWAKDLTAWIVLVASAILEVMVSDAWSQNPNLLLPTISGMVTLLVAGAYGQLKPWLVGMAWIEQNLFNLVPTRVVNTSPPGVPVPFRVSTPTPLSEQVTGPAPVVAPSLTLPTQEKSSFVVQAQKASTVQYPERI